MDSLNAFWGRLGLRTRVVLLTMLFLGAGTLLIVAAETQRMLTGYREDMTHEMDNTVDLLEMSISEQAIIGDYTAIQQIIETRVRKPSVDRVEWNDGRGVVLQASSKKIVAVSPDWFRSLLSLKPLSQSRGITVGGQYYGTFAVSFATTVIENRIWHRLQRRMLESLMFCFAFLAITWVILRDGLGPLAGVSAVARRFLAGDYLAKVRVSPRYAPEIRQLLETMNHSSDVVGGLLLSLSEQRRAMNNAAIVVETDPSGIITYVNDKFCEISGYEREQLLGMDRGLLDSDYHPASFFAGMRARLNAGEVWSGELCNRSRSGRLFWTDAVITPIAGAGGKTVKFISVRFDITSRKLAEDALRQQAQIIDQSLNAVFSLDLNGTVVSWNRGGERLFGYTKDEILDRPVGMLCQGGEEESLSFEPLRALNEDEDYSLEITMRKKTGELFSAHLALSMLKDKEGAEIGIIGYAMDISERKEVEEQIRQSSEQLRRLSSHLQRVREEEKVRIAREIHDELGGTLTALKMDIFWMKRKLPPDQESALEKAETMSALVDSAVQATRRICTELRPTLLDDLGLVAAIEWQAKEYEKRTGIECVINLAESESPLDGASSIALFRILQESLTNITRHAGATRVVIVLRQDGDNILLRIKDNGVGISEEKVLNPLSHGIRGMIERARDLGGDLTVSKAQEGGMEICARIPLKQAERTAA